jgi:hypothetical protein
MAHLNAALTAADFFVDSIVRPDDRKGFKGAPRVVKLQGPFKLYKLTGDKAPQHPDRHVVTPWWSAVDPPFEEDRHGAIGRFKEAYMNEIDMSSMVRYMSAVKVEWNSLQEYVEISIKRGEQVSCFWGEFAPMPLTSDLPANEAKIAAYGATTSGALGYSAAVLPEDLGALSAWQFYIPKLTNDFIEGGSARTCIDAHNMEALGRHFGLDLGSATDLRKVYKRLRFFYRDTQMGLSMTRNPILKQMDACFVALWDLHLAPRETLRRFCELGDSYLKSNSRDPLVVQAKVQQYLTEARKPM